MAIYGHIWVDAQTRNRNETKFFNILLKKKRNYLLKKTNMAVILGFGMETEMVLPYQFKLRTVHTRPGLCVFCSWK